MKKLLVISFAAALLGLGAQFSIAEEELFDAKAAGEYLEKGLVQLRTKHVDAAISALEESVAIAPEAEAYYYLGYAYYLKGRSGDTESRKLSIESFEKAYELDPGFTPTKFKPAEAAIPAEKGLGGKTEPEANKPLVEAEGSAPTGQIAQHQKP